MPANLLLLLAAAIWGFGFVAQTLGMEHLSPFAFNGIRFLMGTFSLVPLVWYLRRQNKLHVSAPKDLVRGSLLVGVLLFAGASFQQVGLQYTTAANAGFITGLYSVSACAWVSAKTYDRLEYLAWLRDCRGRFVFFKL